MTTLHSPLVCKLGTMPVLRRPVLPAVLAGAAASVAFMLFARRNPSRLLVLLFAAWVLSPFVAAILALAKSERWSTIPRATLYVAMLVIALPRCVFTARSLSGTSG